MAAPKESEAANRDAKLAKDELERLRTERIALKYRARSIRNGKTAAEGKAHTMESVAYGTIIILIALLAIASWLLMANRRKARAANHEGGGPETKRTQVVEPASETERASGDDLQPWHTSDMVSSPERAQSSTSDAESTDTREDSKPTAKPDAAEERVRLPM